MSPGWTQLLGEEVFPGISGRFWLGMASFTFCRLCRELNSTLTVLFLILRYFAAGGPLAGSTASSRALSAPFPRPQGDLTTVPWDLLLRFPQAALVTLYFVWNVSPVWLRGAGTVLMASSIVKCPECFLVERILLQNGDISNLILNSGKNHFSSHIKSHIWADQAAPGL